LLPSRAYFLFSFIGNKNKKRIKKIKKMLSKFGLQHRRSGISVVKKG